MAINRVHFLSCTLLLTLASWQSRVLGDDQALPGTTPVEVPDDIYQRQYQQVEDLFTKRIAESESVRAKAWQRDLSSPDNYAKSVEPNRKQVAKLIGLGSRKPVTGAGAAQPLTEGPGYSVLKFDVPLYDDVRVDGLLLLPDGDGPFPVVIACHGDADSPEAICGQAETASGRFAQLLVSKGVAVLAPRLLPRASDHPDGELYKTDLRHIIHRMSYVLAGHPIGVDVDTVSATVDAIPALSEKLDDARVGVVGVGQGGLTAMYAAALDPRLKAAVVVDYVDDRTKAYEEPWDRAIFRHLVEFDDSDVCSLIAPRPLCIVSQKVDGAASLGVEREVAALHQIYEALTEEAADSALRHIAYDAQENARLQAIDASCTAVAKTLGAQGQSAAATSTLAVRPAEDVKARRDQLYAQLKEHFHQLIEGAAQKRRQRWATNASSPDQWQAHRQEMQTAYLDLMGRCDFLQRAPLNPRSQLLYDTDDYRGYKILLDVFDGLEAYGILLVPKNIRPGERRPAVICQHGFAGTPERAIGPGEWDQYYHRFPHELARRGYIAFAAYIVVPDEASEWKLDRRSKVLGESRVGVCIHRYAAIVDFLQELDMVAPDRIGFQGLSFGGYTGLWVVSQEPRISPVICAGYFSDWKARLFDDPKGYMPIKCEEMYVWDVLHGFNHAELASMICPRPFFIEHGVQHGPDWVKWSTSEHRPVEALYAQLGVADRQQFYIFPGHHETGTEEAFRFLDKWLDFTPVKAPTGVVYDAAAASK